MENRLVVLLERWLTESGIAVAFVAALLLSPLNLFGANIHEKIKDAEKRCPQLSGKAAAACYQKFLVLIDDEVKGGRLASFPGLAVSYTNAGIAAARALGDKQRESAYLRLLPVYEKANELCDCTDGYGEMAKLYAASGPEFTKQASAAMSSYKMGLKWGRSDSSSDIAGHPNTDAAPSRPVTSEIGDALNASISRNNAIIQADKQRGQVPGVQRQLQTEAQRVPQLSQPDSRTTGAGQTASRNSTGSYPMVFHDECIQVASGNTGYFRFTNGCAQLVVIREYLQHSDGTWLKGGEDCRGPGQYLLDQTDHPSGRYVAMAQFVKNCGDQGLLTWPPAPQPSHKY